ncbi:DNA repair protein RecO [Tepidibacillus infernus]|uniref:DNA repair protein RecO n=1 Tax=Tepidibacillus infernus TaxID=1806172 RepID=UPI003B7128CB
MLVRTEGIVIRTVDYGETNKIITLYTRTHGKVSLMARGAKKTKSRFSSMSQVFSYGEYIFFLGKEMGSLNQAEHIRMFPTFHTDIEKTAYAAYLIELIDKMTESNDPNPFLFQQLLAGLELIDEGKDEEVIARIFEMKILYISGYRPHLHSCAICGSEEALSGFDIRHGGLVCSKHFDQYRTIALQPITIKLLQMFEMIDMKRIGQVNIKDSTKIQLSHVMKSFFDQYIGITLKSRQFLDQLHKYKE